MSKVVVYNFEDVLAWLHCPAAAVAGYKAKHPLGDVALGERILDEWPTKTNHLAKICPVKQDAVCWLQGTRFATALLTEGEASPPSPESPDDHWSRSGHAWQAHINIETASGAPAVLNIRVPRFQVTNGVLEVVLIDTHPTPPNLARRSDITAVAAFTCDAVRHMTGKHCSARLIAPAYEREEVIEPAPQRIDLFISLLDLIKPISIIRAGTHCNSTEHAKGKSRVTKRWSCPLRESGACNPFGSSNELPV